MNGTSPSVNTSRRCNDEWNITLRNTSRWCNDEWNITLRYTPVRHTAIRWDALRYTPIRYTSVWYVKDRPQERTQVDNPVKDRAGWKWQV